MTDTVRIDKWLWAVRLYRTRTQASEACSAGHVRIADQAVKPARSVRVGEIISARTGHMVRTVRVLSPLDRRVGAPKVKDHLEDLTPASEWAKRAEPSLQPVALRPKGSGRPTKRDRREMDAFQQHPGA
jgi:ribosome-associated heat shock protein Hsp15